MEIDSATVLQNRKMLGLDKLAELLSKKKKVVVVVSPSVSPQDTRMHATEANMGLDISVGSAMHKTVKKITIKDMPSWTPPSYLLNRYPKGKRLGKGHSACNP